MTIQPKILSFSNYFSFSPQKKSRNSGLIISQLNENQKLAQKEEGRGDN